MTQPNALIWYDEHAETLVAEYEALDTVELHDWALNLLPQSGSALDIGAGSGRDAAWFTIRGFQVVAVEPSKGLRKYATALHRGDGVRWLNDQLPNLTATFDLGKQFDLIWLSAVWQHVAPEDRPRAFRAIASLLKPGGLVLLTLRHGPAEPERAMYPVDADETEHEARVHGLTVLRRVALEDRRARPGVSWTGLAFQRPA